MKKKTSPSAARNLDKLLFEAGQQCQKRLWLDYREPVADTPSASRLAMSAAGEQLRALARTAFPKGVAIEATDPVAAARETRERIAAGQLVLFNATFLADGIEARCDVLVLHRAPTGRAPGDAAPAAATAVGAKPPDGLGDLVEIKSGTQVKHRYVNDLALQALVLEQCGLKLRAAYLLHVNPKYVHKEGADYPPMQLLRSGDVTHKVQKMLEPLRRRLQQYRQSLADDAVLQLPMGTFCTSPFPCPYIPRCSKEAPALPLRELPELTRQQEIELHKEGIEDLASLDAKREGLTFRQRRTLACVQQNTRLVEPFVRDELRQCTKPLHFLAIAAITDPLPRFDGQRPWRRVPYAWAAHTVHADGRLETGSFVHVDRTDPRPQFVATLAKHLEVGGTIVVWNDDSLEELRPLLDDLPAAKAAVRALVGHPHLDLMQLFDSGVFHPALRTHADLRASANALLEDASGASLPVFGEDELLAALQKAWAPRIRATTKEKIGADVLAGLTWASERVMNLFNAFAEVAAPAAKAVPAAPRAAQKPLPRPLPKPLPEQM